MLSKNFIRILSIALAALLALAVSPASAAQLTVDNEQLTIAAPEEYATPGALAAPIAPLAIITGNGYTFDTETGTLTVTTNNGTTAWRTDESIHEDTASRYNAITTVIIEDGVDTIGEASFNSCRSLTSISISADVTSIGAVAFLYCVSLTSVTFLCSTPPTIGANAFSNIADDVTVTVPAGTKEAYVTALADHGIAAGKIVEAAGGEEPDITKPTVSEISPANGATGVPISGNIVITFSETMNPIVTEEVLSVSLINYPIESLLLNGTWSNGNKTYTVSYNNRAYSTTYVVEITAFRDAAGNRMDNDDYRQPHGCARNPHRHMEQRRRRV